MDLAINEKEKELLLELISNEQIHMIMKDSSKYESKKYKRLEKLKIKLKNYDFVKSCFLECP